MKAYKGFNKDMTCRGFQFEEGKTYETDEAKLCKSGFHACEMPLNCFDYYAPASSEYHEVELEDVSDEREDDTKVCAKKIKIGAKLDIAGIVKAQFEYVKERCTNNDNGGNWSALNGGNMSCLRGGAGAKFKGGMYAVFAAEIWQNGSFIGMKAAIVDGETIKPDTWYTLKDGEFVEV